MTRDVDDTQGNILRGYTHLPHVAYLFFRILEPDAVKGLLARTLPRISTDAHWGDKSLVHLRLNVAFTYQGLEKLGHQGHFDRTEYVDFRDGMAARAREQLADTGVNEPECWESPLRHGADLLFTVYWHGSDTGDAAAAGVGELLRSSGLEQHYVQRADMLAGRREQFGFADGFSQPVVESASGAPWADATGEGVLEPANLLRLRLRSRWRSVRLGEFLLGHRDEDDVVPGGDDPWLRNGTFMIWRKLEQHIGRFERWMQRAAGDDSRQRAWLEAKVVGRWRDGSSLIDAPHRPRCAAGKPGNTFRYGGDPAGVRCPIGAHVRRANPRDALGWGTDRTRRHRIIRRGVPYDDPGDRKGLIFVAFNASIARQFELIQGRWLMDGDAFGLGSDRDLLVGHDDHDAASKLTIDGDRRRPVRFLPAPDQPLITTRGGYYLFVPAIAALREIATV